MALADKNCSPSNEGDHPFDQAAAEKLLPQIDPDWELTDNAKKLKRRFNFKNFAKPMKLATIVGDIAEKEDHHPDLHVSWGHLIVVITSHRIGGLCESDFIFAAKTDRAFHQAFLTTGAS